MYVNRICTQNINNCTQAKNNKPNTSFGMAYHLTDWNKTFDNATEEGLINKVFGKIKTKTIELLGKDGITYKFKTPDGDFLYTRETKGMMSNLKFVPNNRSDEGFYIINNKISPNTNKFIELTRSLDEEIKRQTSMHRTMSSNGVKKHYPIAPQKVLTSNRKYYAGFDY